MRVFQNLSEVLMQPDFVAGGKGENPIKYIFFDLDGTLTDPGIGITNSVMHALRKMGVEPPDREELYSFIGPPLIDSFMKYYCMTGDEARQAVVYYREYFSVKGLFENTLYDGICQLLSGLKGKGYKLVVATSKPDVFSVKILEHFDLIKYFDFVAGATMEETRTKKAEVIQYALESLGIDDPISKKGIIMVGDRAQDVNGAHACGIRCVGVLYGYGDEAEMASCGADYIVASVG